jgi:hypothetical protein
MKRRMVVQAPRLPVDEPDPRVRLERVRALQPKQGLGVGLFSYAGTLGWSFTADRDQAPDLHVFADAVLASFEELERVARA